MDVRVYKSIINDIKYYGGLNVNGKVYTYLSTKYKNISPNTLRSIISLWYQRRVSSNTARVKEIDIYKLYKDQIALGNEYACLTIAEQLYYPPVLIAKIILTRYVTEKKKDVIVPKLCNYCNSKKAEKSKNCINNNNEDINENFTLKKHIDPRIELVLNLFDEDDEVGKYFLEKFKYSGNTKNFKDQNTSKSKFYSEPSQFEKMGESNVMCKNIERLFSNKKSNNVSINCSNSSDKNCSNNIKDNHCDIPIESFKKSVSLTNESLNSKSCVNNEKQKHCTCIRSDLTDSDSDSDSENSNEFAENFNVKELLENTSLIEDPVLAKDIFMCTMSDDQFGPISDVITNSAGVTYEYLLEDYVKNAGLPYKSENKLRGIGVDKTPDIILLVPVAVDGFIINWIESKALFADYRLHQDFKKHQYKNYINRFGTGFVIYWHGYIDEIPELYLENKKIIIRDHFPSKESFTFVNSNKFKTWMQSEKKCEKS